MGSRSSGPRDQATASCLDDQAVPVFLADKKISVQGKHPSACGDPARLEMTAELLGGAENPVKSTIHSESVARTLGPSASAPPSRVCSKAAVRVHSKRLPTIH